MLGNVLGGFNHTMLGLVAVPSNSVECLRGSVSVTESVLHGVEVLLFLDWRLLHRLVFVFDLEPT